VAACILEAPDVAIGVTTVKEAAVRQLTLRFAKQESKALALPTDVEKTVLMQMAQLIVDLVQKRQRSRDDQQTEQHSRNHARATDQQ
jgi:hypothetical protein